MPPDSAARAVQRVQSLWLASTFLLVLLIITIALLGGGQLRRTAREAQAQLKAAEDLAARVEKLESSNGALQKQLRDLQSAVARATSRPVPTPSPTTAPTVIADADTTIRGELERALKTDDPRQPVVADPTLADALVARAQREGDAAQWSGATWGRLAVLARVMGRDEAADTFSMRAEKAGVLPRQDLELATRARIAAGQGAEAVALARRLHAAGRPDAEAVLLLAEGQRLLGNQADAFETLSQLRDPSPLALPDKLRLASLLAWLERWSQLDALLRQMGDAPADAMDQINRDRAGVALHQQQSAEALALIDAQLEDHPDDYLLRVWRGAALVQAGQWQPARDALAIAETKPDRPEAWYWLGVLELRQGDWNAAQALLQKSLTGARNAPALEALATIAINRNELENAIQTLNAAIQTNPSRASSHLLLALTQAKAGRKAQAATALSRALSLEPELTESARRMEVLAPLFSMPELRGAVGREPSAP